MLFFAYQAIRMFKQGKFGIVYSIMFFFGIFFIILIMTNGLAAYKPNKYPLPAFMQVTFIQIISSMAAIVLGVVSLVISQKQYQDNRNEKISDDVASPLYLEIEELKKNFLENFFTLIDVNIGNYNSTWKSFQKTSKKIVATDISKDIIIFYDDCKKYCRNLNTIYVNNQSIIRTQLNSMLEKFTSISTADNTYDFFRAFFEDEYGIKHNVSLTKYIMLNIDLIDNLSINFTDFNESSLKLRVYAIKHGWVEIDFIKEHYLEFVKNTESKLSNESEVKKIREDRVKLIKLADKVMTDLKKHIISIDLNTE